MYGSVVVAVKDVGHGRDGLQLAKALMSRDAHVMLVHVEVLQVKPLPETDTRADVEKQHFGLERLRRLRDDSNIAADLVRIRAPSVRQGIHEFAARQGADLIVIGAGSHNPIARSIVGDEAREVLEDAPCAVAVAPRGYATRPGELRVIGVAYDGSPESEQALALAKRLAAELGASVSAFEAIHAPVYARDVWDVEGEIDQEVAEAQERIAALRHVEGYAALADDTVAGLRQYEGSVDLLVMGAHAERPPERVLRRSKSQRLADESASPLLVLSASETNP